MGYVIAVDSGGTFADCVVLDDTGRVTTAKAPSTPDDYSRGVIAAVARAAEELGLELAEVLGAGVLFGHGTTVATNALLTRSGSRVGLITTRGHEDALIIGRTIQKAAGLSESELTQLSRLEKADPVVPRPLIKGITERVDYKGAVVVPLDLEDARRAAAELADQGVEAIAVCLLWSFMNPAHELAVKEMVQAEFPQLFVTVSHELAPVIKEYERAATTALNAYLSRATLTYVSALQDRLAELGFRHQPVIMQSSGGVTAAGEAKTRAVSLLSSGPAGGVIGAAALGRLLGYPNVITTDVGGTSFDVGLVVDGEPVMSGRPVFAKYHTVLPVIDVASIGAGGGSVAWIEPGTGLLKVGPRSAGAVPGPACYGAGGVEPTVTDANVVMNRIDPAFFLGGRKRLDRDLAVQTIRTRIADPLGITVEEAAAGIVEILDARMADLVRKETIGRGYDPGDFALFAFGGAGPLHVAAYGVDVGARAVIVPGHASEFSAFGIAGSDLVTIQQVSDPMFAPFDLSHLQEIYGRLEQAARRDLERNGIPAENAVLVREIEMRYRGQVHEVRVPVPGGELPADAVDGIVTEFERRYDRKYGYGAGYRQAGIEARTYLVRGIGRLVKPALQPEPAGPADPAAARSGERPVYFRSEGRYCPTVIYRYERLRAGHVVPGPAIIEAVDTTVLVPPGLEAVRDGWGSLSLRPEGGRS